MNALPRRSTGSVTDVKVGDTWLVEPHGERKVERIKLVSHPSFDSAAESTGASVEICELGANFVVDLSGGNWAYGSQLLELVERS